MNAAHRHTDTNLQHSSTSGTRTSQMDREVKDPSVFHALSDRQAVIAVMAANGRTNQQISLRLRIPVRAVEQYLNEALDILRLASQRELTYPAITTHFTKTSAASRARSTHQDTISRTDTFTPLSTTSNPAPQTVEPAPALSSVPAEGTVPGQEGMLSEVSGPSSAMGDKLLDSLDQYPSIIRDATNAVRVLALAPDDDDRCDLGYDGSGDQDAAEGRAVAAALKLLEQERETVGHLQKALHTRDVIGQAKGILMERHKISSDAALALLRDESSRSNRKLTDIAAQIAYTG